MSDRLWQVDVVLRTGWYDLVERYGGHAIGVCPVYAFLAERGAGELHAGFNFICPLNSPQRSSGVDHAASLSTRPELTRGLAEAASLLGDAAQVASWNAHTALCLRAPVLLSASSIRYDLSSSFLDRTPAAAVIEALAATCPNGVYAVGSWSQRLGSIFTGSISLFSGSAYGSGHAEIQLHGAFNPVLNPKITGPCVYGFDDKPQPLPALAWPFSLT